MAIPVGVSLATSQFHVSISGSDSGSSADSMANGLGFFRRPGFLAPWSSRTNAAAWAGLSVSTTTSPLVVTVTLT